MSYYCTIRSTRVEEKKEIYSTWVHKGVPSPKKHRLYNLYFFLYRNMTIERQEKGREDNYRLEFKGVPSS